MHHILFICIAMSKRSFFFFHPKRKLTFLKAILQ